MTRTARFLAVGAAVLAAACGGSSTTSGGGTPSTGTATFSGDATGTLAVYVLGNLNSGSTFTSLSILSGVFGSAAITEPNFGFEAEIPGTTLTPGSFESPTNGTQTDYVNQAMQTWGQFSGSSNQFGTSSLTLSSVGSPTSGAANTTVWYSAHGTLSATMIPVQGNSTTGNVTVSVTF
jgi:hypothetical protein